MNKEIDYSDVPKNYLFCTHNKCPHRNKCLRYQATLLIPHKEKPTYATVNPLHIAGNEDNCKYFKLYATTRFAAGMDHLLDNLVYGTAVAIRKDLLALMGHSMYYRIKNRERLLHPIEQEQIAAIFVKHGINAKPQFDSYIDKYAW